MKAIRASVLVLLLCSVAHAGYIPNDAPAPPPSHPASAVQEPTANGFMGNDAPDSLTQTVLDLLAVLPSLF